MNEADNENLDRLLPPSKEEELQKQIAQAQKQAYLQQLDGKEKKMKERLARSIRKKKKNRAHKKYVKRLKRGKHK